jgi:hypothetical protein
MGKAGRVADQGARGHNGRELSGMGTNKNMNIGLVRLAKDFLCGV